MSITFIEFVECELFVCSICRIHPCFLLLNVLCVIGSLQCLLYLFKYKGKHGHNDFFIILNEIFNDLRLLKL